MIKNVAEAIARGDYLEAEQLLQTLPVDDPWVKFYTGQLQELSQNWQQAESTYKQLLQAGYGAKIAVQARQGLQRLAELKQAQRQQTMTQATQAPGSEGMTVLILEPLPPETKTEAAKKFAQVMNIDAYVARLLLPSRGWRLYRSGSLAEIQVYGQELRAAGIPVFWLPVAKLSELQVMEVHSFQRATAQSATVSGNIARTPTPELTFSWSEVSQSVSGLLPIFEQVVDLDRQRKIQRKEQIQDYAQICDLHLPARRIILRFYSGAYQFHQGMSLTPASIAQVQAQGTSWANWKQLEAFFNHYLPDLLPLPDFTVFGESAIEHPEVLEPIQPHIDLFRREESPWDQAFHLYSSLIFWKNQS